MPIEFVCPGCRKILRVPDAAVGKRARCPDCGRIELVPASPGDSSNTEFPASPGFASSAEADTGSTWTTGNWAPDEPLQQTENPFASPHESFQAENLSSPYISSKVSAPAIGLMVAGILNLCVSALQCVGIFFSVAMPGAAWRGNQVMAAPNALAPVLLMVGVVFIILLRDAFIIYGALQMKNMKSYSMALTAAILALIPCNSICCLIYLPMAIWALVVLSDQQVKFAFRRARAN